MNKPFKPRSRAGTVLLLAYACSGAVGLAYEVLWTRMLSLQFGVSIFGVIVTVAAFMLGLGGGSLVASTWATRVHSPLKVVALLEAGVALYALLLPWLMQGLGHALQTLAPGVPLTVWHALQAAAAIAVLSLPATALGAGFPLVLRAAMARGGSVAAVYGANTCGAAAGALFPLLLLPAVGWATSVVVVASAGALVGVSFWVLHARTDAGIASQRTAVRPSVGTLLAYAGVGAAALMLQVGWTRLYGMVLLRTEYVLAVLLAVFLLGIGLGGLLGRSPRAQRWLSVLPWVGAGWALVSLAGLPWLAGWAERAEFGSLYSALLWQGLAVAVAVFPVTLALGAWLPLLGSVLGPGATPWLYGVNSVGAAAGAVLAGFLLIPLLGTTGTLVVAALLLFACGMAWVRVRWSWFGLAALVPAGAALWEMPPVAALLPDSQQGSRDLYRHEDAVSITHVVERPDGERLLLADLQRMDASTEPQAVASQQNQARLPLLLHPAPRSVLYLGLGTGISVAGGLPFGNLEVTAVEISAGAIYAADRYFGEANAGVVRRIRVVRDDARRFLDVNQRQYDVIVGDLFHPDLVGRSSLLAVQQFERARRRLAPGGIFVQWLAVNQFDVETLRVVVRSFHQAFPEAVLFVDGFRLAMVGPREGLAPASRLAARAQQLSVQATGGEGVWTWLGRYWGRLQTDPGPVQDEWAPRVEFSLPRARYRGALDVVSSLEWLLGRRPALAVAAAELGVPAGDETFERAFVATELYQRAWRAELRGLGEEGARLLQFAYQANPRDRWIGLHLADRLMQMRDAMRGQGVSERQALEMVLKMRPDHVEALRALWRLEQRAGRHEQARAYRERLARVNPFDRALRE